MTLKEAIKRIKELELRVKELEAKPLPVPIENHYHYHYQYQQPAVVNPLPSYPNWPLGPVWISDYPATAVGASVDWCITTNNGSDH